MIEALLATLAFHVGAGTTLIWQAPLESEVDGSTEPIGRVEEVIELIGNPGSIVRFQLAVRPTTGDWLQAALETESFAESWPLMRVRTFAETPAEGAPDDVLIPASAFDIAEDTTRALWVDQFIPQYAEGGVYECNLRLTRENGPSKVIPILLRVYEIGDNEIQTLPVTLPIEPTSGQPVFSEASLRPWVELGSRLDITFSPIGRAPPDERVVWAATMAKRESLIVDMGGGTEWLEAYPKPASPRLADPLVEVMQRWGNALDNLGQLENTFLLAESDADVGSWPEIRDRYYRLRQADRRIRLALVGGFHPRYLPYADILAVPWDRYDWESHRQLAETGSLSFIPGIETARIEASSTGGAPSGMPASTEPLDAYDGNARTAWWSRAVPSARLPVEFVVEFAESTPTESITIGWAPEGMGRDIVVRISLDGKRFNRSRVDWSREVTRAASGAIVMDGEFRSPRSMKAVSIEMRGSVNGNPVGISEIEFAPPQGPLVLGRKVAVWMARTEDGFGSLRADEARGDAILIPWVCWTQGLEGYLATEAVNVGKDALVYSHPDSGELLTTARLELLHQGLMDYQLLAAAREAALSADRIPTDVNAAIAPVSVANVEAEGRAEIALGLESRRKSLIRWLAQISEE